MAGLQQRTSEQIQLHANKRSSGAPFVPVLPPSINKTLSQRAPFEPKVKPIKPQPVQPHNHRRESMDEVSRLRDEYKAFTDDLLDWAASQENLDVYQMNAFYARTHDLSYYWRNYWKTFCVQFIQTAGLVILLYYDWNQIIETELHENATETEVEEEDDPYDRGICSTEGHILLKLLAFFLISFLSMRLSDQIATISQYGMYSWGNQIMEPHFIHWGWVAYGLMVNYITLVGSCFISTQVVYLSETPLDMILNFVALYFIIELDDEVVTWQNYEDIEDWIKGVDDKRDRHYSTAEQGFDVDVKSEAPYETWLYMIATTDRDEYEAARGGCCGSFRNGFVKCGMCTMKKTNKCRDPRIARNLMLPLIILLP
eukprot:131933_1